VFRFELSAAYRSLSSELLCIIPHYQTFVKQKMRFFRIKRKLHGKVNHELHKLTQKNRRRLTPIHTDSKRPKTGLKQSVFFRLRRACSSIGNETSKENPKRFNGESTTRDTGGHL